MKTNLLATLTLAAAISPMVTAQTVTKFPEFLPSLEAMEHSGKEDGMMRAPLNPNAAMGTRIFGATTQDYNRITHLVDLWTEKPGTLNKYQDVFSPEDSEMLTHAVLSGAWAGDKWVGYKARFYTFEFRLTSWIEADPTTGTFEVLREYEDVALTTPIMDLAWNPQDEALYGLAYSDYVNPDGTVTMKLVQVDPENGDMVPGTVFQFPHYYFCMAYNYDGLLYAIRWNYDSKGQTVGSILDIYDPEDDYYLTKTVPLTVDGKAFKIAYQNTLEFDYTTGELWWGAVDADRYQYIVNINPETFATTNKGKVGIGESITGMYIPYRTADSRTAPARVEDLNFTIDANGANKVTLSWTNPSKTWNRKNLSALKEVLIYRDNENGTPVATLDASGKVGAQMSWTDEGASQGIHTYYVVPCAKAGEKGVAREIEAYVGHDVPGPVENLFAMTDGKVITINWKAPTRGDNDGWFDKTTVKYNIVRLPDNVDLGSVTATTYTDNSLDEAMTYSYVITPENADGKGSPTTSNGCLAGTNIRVPFSTDFMTSVDAERFVGIDANGDGRTWDYDMNLNLRRNTMHLDCSDYGNDDVLVSPPLNLKKGMKYKVKYGTSVGGYGQSDRIYLQHIKFIGGTDSSLSALTDEYEDMVDRAVEGLYAHDDVVTYFTSPVDGTYYFGFELLTEDESNWWMYVESFSIEEAPAIDMEAETISCPAALSSNGNNTFEVLVTNNGNDDNSNYKVQVAYLNKNGEPVVFAETNKVPTVKSEKSATVEVIGHPQEIEGVYEIVGIVVAENDGNTHNDMTASRRVTFESADPFTHKVGEKQTTSSEAPFSYYRAGHGTQTIYTPDMTGIDLNGMEEPKITRVGWEYVSEKNIENTDFALYYDQTTRTGYREGDTNWIAPQSAPVYDGKISIVEGENILGISFNEPREFDANKPFILTISKFEMSNAGTWPVLFNVFDDDWYLDEFHTLFARGNNAAVDPRNPNAEIIRSPVAPVLHISIAGKMSGVEEIVLTGKATYFFNSQTGILHANNSNLRTVDVFDFAGRSIKRVSVNGENQVALNLPAGMYILRLTEANGNTATLKVQANR